MAVRWWPRSIRWQMLTGLLLLEALSICLFGVLLFRQQTRRTAQRAQQMLRYESTALAEQSAEALEQQKPSFVDLATRTLVDSPQIETAEISSPAGDILFAHGEVAGGELSATERAQIAQVKGEEPRVFTTAAGDWEAVRAIYTGNQLRGYAWVTFDRSFIRQQLDSLLSDTSVFGIVWMAASAVLVLLMARSIAQPLAVLHHGATALTTSPGEVSGFPLPVAVHNEIGDLIETFNRMVASLSEQRAGLNDTLSLLDSMLANAPIGLAFVDRNGRFVRVNQVFASFTGAPLSRHLGRTLHQLFPQPIAQELEGAVERVFAREEPVRNLELSGNSGRGEGEGRVTRPWTWLISAYPVRTMPNQVRWAGVIVLDASDRKRSEDALRRSEKLAVAGRLAASIAHEINNPLEAITNLLFLLHNYGALDDGALKYVKMAEHEVRRVSEITQQTLRFYRQSTLPGRATLGELLDSILSLYQGRANVLGIHIERRYDPKLDVFCFAGEIRQVIANLVGNSIDATIGGGRLLVRARRSHHWKNDFQPGIRFVVADTGIGMAPGVRERVFEPFFTTKETTGTGLGLWVSHEIIAKHHGFVHVRTRAAAPDKPSGTVFQIFIPDNPDLANANLPVASSRDAEEELLRHQEAQI